MAPFWAPRRAGRPEFAGNGRADTRVPTPAGLAWLRRASVVVAFVHRSSTDWHIVPTWSALLAPRGCLQVPFRIPPAQSCLAVCSVRPANRCGGGAMGVQRGADGPVRRQTGSSRSLPPLNSALSVQRFERWQWPAREAALRDAGGLSASLTSGCVSSTTRRAAPASRLSHAHPQSSGVGSTSKARRRGAEMAVSHRLTVAAQHPSALQKTRACRRLAVLTRRTRRRWLFRAWLSPARRVPRAAPWSRRCSPGAGAARLARA